MREEYLEGALYLLAGLVLTLGAIAFALRLISFEIWSLFHTTPDGFFDFLRVIGRFLLYASP
jgi:hypothetical protein